VGPVKRQVMGYAHIVKEQDLCGMEKTHVLHVILLVVVNVEFAKEQGKFNNL